MNKPHIYAVIETGAALNPSFKNKVVSFTLDSRESVVLHFLLIQHEGGRIAYHNEP